MIWSLLGYIGLPCTIGILGRGPASDHCWYITFLALSLTQTFYGVENKLEGQPYSRTKFGANRSYSLSYQHTMCRCLMYTLYARIAVPSQLALLTVHFW